MRLVLFVALLLLAPPALAQAPDDHPLRTPTPRAETPRTETPRAHTAPEAPAKRTPPPRAARRAADPDGCQLGEATADLDAGGVRARLYNTGGLFWRGGDPLYEVPKDSGVGAIFAASIWVGGTVDGEVRFAGADFADWEWWPGPLGPDGSAPADCAPYDRIWTVTVQEDGTLAGDVTDWPADLGAPFEDADGDGAYEPAAGERPTVYGHQTAFWVMNDRGNTHRWGGTEALGLEARVTAFTFNEADPALGFGTFYRYELHNPNGYAVEDARFGLWMFNELGGWDDDYEGSDSTRGMTLLYNSDPLDSAYGSRPPALGIDVLSGAAGMIYSTGDSGPTGNPADGEDAYGYLNFTWRDGVPLTAFGRGYNPGSCCIAPTTWMWPGAPERLAFWSEFDTDSTGHSTHPASNGYPITVAAPFRLAPGASHTVDLAILWARGYDHLDSVVRLRGHSDRVQAAYDDGSLFAPAGLPTGPPDGAGTDRPPPTLPAPVLVAPADGADLDDLELERDPTCAPEDPAQACEYVVLEWQPVPGADLYEVLGRYTTETRLRANAYSEFEKADVAWSVRARNATEVSAESAPRTYTTRSYIPDVPRAIMGGGAGIVEVAGPVDPCGDEADSTGGCTDYGGNTVWHSLNSTSDYYLSASGSGQINRLERYAAAAFPDDFEIRFTGETSWAVDAFETGHVLRVPFELWNVGTTPADAADDVRMIPFVLSNSEADSPIVDWFAADDVYPGTDATFEYPASDVLYFLMPDRPDGYGRFAEVAARTGAGNVYPFGEDGDDVDAGSPAGGDCGNNGLGLFVDFCYGADDLVTPASFVYPIGRVVIADYAGDGTPPPPGTVIRIQTTKPYEVATEDEPTLATSPSLTAYPNPAGSAASVSYALPSAGRARVAVYDVLGRRVAVLARGDHGPGTHRAALDTGRLANGVYVVVLETEAGRRTQTLTVLR